MQYVTSLYYEQNQNILLLFSLFFICVTSAEGIGDELHNMYLDMKIKENVWLFCFFRSGVGVGGWGLGVGGWGRGLRFQCF